MTRTLSSHLPLLNHSNYYNLREYACDYIEGYPGWDFQTKGDKLLLERQKGGGKDRIIFRAPVDSSREIVIPAENISQASIISRKGCMKMTL